MNIWIWLPDYLVSRLYLTTVNLEVSFFIWKIVLWPIEYVRMVVVWMVALEILPLYIYILYIVCIYYILNILYIIYTLRKKCPYSELFWSAFSRFRNEYGEIIRISMYSVWIRENADQNNSEYGHFSRVYALFPWKFTQVCKIYVQRYMKY